MKPVEAAALTSAFASALVSGTWGTCAATGAGSFSATARFIAWPGVCEELEDEDEEDEIDDDEEDDE